jgi:diguanylate cyclase (GGDEF)-like protein/PAS domain S-box-containing protein
MSATPHKDGLTRLPIRAAAFVALVCIAILGLSGWREWSSRAATLATAEVEMGNLAHSLAQHAENSFDLMDASIVGISVRLELDGTGPESIAKLQKILDARKNGLKRLFNIVILDEHGNFVATSGTMGPSLGDRAFFLHHLRSAALAPFIGPPIQSKISGDWIITLSRRFNRPDGSFAGVVFSTIGADYFANFYRQFDIGAHGSITLLSAAGIVIARSPDNAAYAGRDTSDDVLFRDPSLQSVSGIYTAKSPLDGLLRMIFYKRSDRYPLVVLATRQHEEVLASWRSAAVIRMLFVLGLVMLIAVMGLYLVRHLQRGQRLVAEIASKEANFRVLAEGSGDMVTRIGMDDRVQYASPSSVRVLGFQPDQLVDRPAFAGVNEEDLPGVEETVAALKRGEVEEARVTYRARHLEKSEIWVESTLRVTRSVNGEIDGAVAITRDITRQKDLEEKLETLATQDGLTGIANRRRFDERLLEEWGRAYRERTRLGLLMIDLDHFKQFNDSYGHQVGDECLRSIAGILTKEAQRTTDLPVRYGGEEFAMLLPNTDAAGCARIGERIRRAILEAGIPHALNLPCGLVTASVGGAICRPAVERSAGHASLLEAADRALYEAKDGGRNRVVMAVPAVRVYQLASGAR